MLKLFFLFLLTLTSESFADVCCGPVNPKALTNEAIFDTMNVEQKWQNGVHINWETGETDRPPDYQGPDKKSHCSAFAAALAKKFSIYLLHPPEHPQQLLATAQAHWLLDKKSADFGWKRLKDMKEAQTMANQGAFVIAVYPSPHKKKAGHIAVLRSSKKSTEDLLKEGPQIIQAGTNNYQSTDLKNGFRFHKDAFPSNILFFIHDVQ
jgi:hypothetical protein